ncbi:MAG TPA: hypothetical protein VNJ08_00560 [Bacteriovoracaceae bacterium]|nr:hypothetical protein [Bacteriovoracaceae bacterium]
MKLTLIAAMLCFFATSAFAQIGFPILCRGGYTYQLNGPIDGRVTVTFKPNTIAAGETGKDLKMGTCAFVDRPINAEEPTTFSLFMGLNLTCSTTDSGISCNLQNRLFFDQTMSMFQQCSTNENCIIRAVVSNNSGRFEVDASRPNVSISLVK